MNPTRIITIRAASVSIDAVLNGSETAQKLWDALPVESAVSKWGDEIYFSIPITMNEENASEVVEIGDIAYWPPGSAFCIFYGRTPASTNTEIRAASAVNNLGKIRGEAQKLGKVPSGAKIRIEKK